MKRLMAKKWFRITVRVSMGLMSLLVLAWLWFNWWGASRKRMAMAEVEKAGLSVKLEDFTKDMPPSEDNFARQGLFKQWEDAYERGWPGNAGSPSSPQGLYDSMGDEVFGRAFTKNRGRKSKSADFSGLPKDGPYGQTAGRFLAEYDRRHAAVLRDLQAGFALAHMRRPFLATSFSGDASDLPSLSEAFGLKLRRVADGLTLRAEAALATDDPAKAAESIEVLLRLSEAMGSRGMLVSVLIEVVGVRAALGPLRNGIERHLWTEADLTRIEGALGRLDPRRDMRRAIESEILMIHMIEALKDGAGRGKMSDTVIIEAQDGDWDPLGWVVAKKPHWLPDAVFDLNEAALLNHIRRASTVISSHELAKDWWQEAERQFQDRDRRKGTVGKVIWAYPASAVGLKAAARAMVEVRLALAACALERYYLKNRAYPATLEALGTEIARDPFHGGSFRYQSTADSFKLYSVGPDGKDDGGERKGRMPLMEQADWAW